ncbi:Trafficking protein particle complex subunit 10 Epilepsy holoprosencephaly candidate 1 protein [Channa argus]|uniref:Trafficking protein particle complex subunit 10 Epilepsy holoprosencephaly candidate 1 protein n=1 Tax=Channa argus TaxID=215402 RepID=A0A6G1PWG7_CHAAH|nr:Trafficking protein particle complex subunit 10 Epilepsy holoprosencephaly candidate 1 protein [Channa argus]
MDKTGDFFISGNKWQRLFRWQRTQKVNEGGQDGVKDEGKHQTNLKVKFKVKTCFTTIALSYLPLWFTLDYISDLMYMLDMVITAHTGYLDQGILIKDLTLLRKRYLGSKCFLRDLASLLPTDLLYFVCGTQTPLVRINRFLRFPRLSEALDRMETRTSYPNTFRLSKLMIYIFVLIHWNACLYFALSSQIGFGSDEWVYPNITEEFASMRRQYFHCFWFSSKILTTVGDIPLPNTEEEFLFMIADLLIAVLVFASVVGNVGNVVSSLRDRDNIFFPNHELVKAYLRSHQVSKELQQRINNWYQHLHINKKIIRENEILEQLPIHLRTEIAVSVHLPILSKVTIFQNCEKSLLEELVLKLTPQVFSPGEYVCRKGDVGHEMYIIKEGKLAVVADDGITEFAVLGAGNFFGEISILNIKGNKLGNRRTANIRSTGYSDLFSLSKEDLTNVLSEFPAAKRHLEEKGKQILIKMGMLENTQDGEEKEEEKLETKIKRLEDTLDILQTKLARLMMELESSNCKMQARVEQLEWEAAALNNQLRGAEEEDGGGAQGRGEGVGGVAEWEREEAEGEEEEGSDAKIKKQEQREDGNEVIKEGDGESTKSTKEHIERLVEGDGFGQKDPDNQEKKNEDDGEKKQEKGDDRPGKGDGAEIEPDSKTEEKSLVNDDHLTASWCNFGKNITLFFAGQLSFPCAKSKHRGRHMAFGPWDLFAIHKFLRGLWKRLVRVILGADCVDRCLLHFKPQAAPFMGQRHRGAGDQGLFTSLYTSLAQQLPREPMEWRRTYGRAPKMIHLEANFVQFKEELLPKEGNKALLTFPFLHIYWTDCCDTEAYKSSVKEDMMRWHNSLRAHSSPDWVIIVVETNDTKKKNKTNILPRSSIVDKIRSDFCNKQNDRCVVLSDPLKDSSRSQESWNSLLLKLRTLLLMSFTKNLGHFEDDMRTLREKRTQPGWSFCEYFMVQEELAFVFEMLQQFEDALVQYDELDALFTQYVLNFGAGDTANWLGSFCAPVQNWSGLLLRRPIDMEKRDGIQRGEASLLDLRSYLFSRQCTLLIFLQRPWEVTQRALELLHNCVQELRLLEVSVLEGALDCWVFLSCLEVLHRIEGCCDQAQLAANCSHTVGLWAYATDKLKSLGELCGLVSEKGPTSEDLNRTVDLLAGLGDERPETVHSLQSPYKKLKEALSSVEAFERHYLELSHAAMEMYTAIGRLRSARLVGKSLAEFYIYLQTSALLAGDVNLTTEERKHFCQEILTFAAKSGEESHKVTLSMSVFAQLLRLQFHPATASVHSGAKLQVELTAAKFDAQVCAHTASPALELDEMHDRSPSDNSLNSAGVVCKNTHLLLRLHESNSPTDTPNCLSPPVTMTEGAQMLKVQDTTLEPGDNSIIFTAPSDQPGTYTLRQLCATVGQVQFVLPHIYPSVQYEVYSQEPQLTVEPLSEPLLAGLPQLVKFTLLTGHYTVKKGVALQLSNTDTMPILPSTSCIARISNPAAELVGESVLSIQSSEKVTSISLPPTPPYHTLEFQLEVLCIIPSGSDRAANERLTNGEVRHRPRSYSHPDTPMTAIDQRMSIDCPWSIYSTLLALTFYIPFKTKHSLLSADNRKYIQVCVQNVSDVNFMLAEVNLTEKQHASLELQSLNTKTQQTLYSVKAEILPPAGEQHCRSGFLCGLEVCITRLTEPAEETDTDGPRTIKLMYEVADSSSNWAVCGKSSGLVSMPLKANATHKVQIEVMPLFAGHLPFPKIKVSKYLPHTAAVAIQPDPGNFHSSVSLSNVFSANLRQLRGERQPVPARQTLDDQADTASIRSRGSVHSVGSGDQQQKGVAMPRLEPFCPGQVFNHSYAQQVLVLPTTDDHIMEVNAT